MVVYFCINMCIYISKICFRPWIDCSKWNLYAYCWHLCAVSCGPGSLNLYCTPASLSGSCPSMQCPNSNVMLSNVSTHPTSAGCNVSSCSYGGFVNGTITTS
ncbi:hypothetical protein SETIT_9G011000v2 [Setaria italica]|uniref:Uncharacterized protein n=1 Tax=Setaria italica TaxID=4555 RepID=A0A368SC69_SETIT|nr:hypothetical protein SETIT_9G011000v2 [Setaria italica]